MHQIAIYYSYVYYYCSHITTMIDSLACYVYGTLRKREGLKKM